MRCEIFSSEGFVRSAHVTTLGEARQAVWAALCAGHRKVTAEVVDEGEIVAYYQRGSWAEER